MDEETLKIVSSKVVYTLEDGSSVCTKPRPVTNKIYDVNTSKVITVYAQHQNVIQP